jgi:hypothetical protein
VLSSLFRHEEHLSKYTKLCRPLWNICTQCDILGFQSGVTEVFVTLGWDTALECPVSNWIYYSWRQKTTSSLSQHRALSPTDLAPYARNTKTSFEFRHWYGLILQKIISERIFFCGPGSSVGIATDDGLDGLGIESRWGEIFRRPDRP